MTNRSRCIIRLALSAASLAVRLVGQETQEQQTTIKVDVRQVLVPVIVTDKEGHHLSGLARQDFKVYEDGVEQNISGFAVQSSRLPFAESAAAVPVKRVPGTEDATPNPVPPGRTYLICIDSLHTSFPNVAHLRDALKKLFREESAGDSQYSVMAIGRTVQVLQPTTRNPLLVLKAIESKDFQKVLQGSYKDSLQTELDAFRRRLEEVRRACDAGDPDCIQKESLPLQANAIAEHDRMLTPEFLRQFRGVVEQLSQATGRRTIVFISDGFSLTPGKAPLEYLAAYFPEMRGIALRAKERVRSDFEPIVRLAVTSNIPIYTIDSRGLYGMQYFDASNPGSVARIAASVQQIMNAIASEQGDSLAEMAAATGGTAFHNSNDLLAGLKRAFADGREFYTLAYVSSNVNLDGKFREIRVEVRARNAVVNAKRGYWATRS